MSETLAHVVEARGVAPRAVVWARNCHLGDARLTEMGIMREELNLGQLCRERFAGKAALIGFGTHSGTVAAASDWDGAMAVMRVRPSHADSYERLCHAARLPRFLLALRSDDALRCRLAEPRLQRYIGVVYRPKTEFASHYAESFVVPAVRSLRLVRRKLCAHSLAARQKTAGAPDTYPFGL